MCVRVYISYKYQLQFPYFSQPVALKIPGGIGTTAWWEQQRGRVTANRLPAALGFCEGGSEGFKVWSKIIINHQDHNPTTLAKLQAQVPQKSVILDKFYSKITALPIIPSMFIPLQQWSGRTPDYLVGKDGGLTIKSSLSKDQKPSPVLGGAWYADTQALLACTLHPCWQVYHYTSHNGCGIFTATPNTALQTATEVMCIAILQQTPPNLSSLRGLAGMVPTSEAHYYHQLLATASSSAVPAYKDLKPLRHWHDVLLRK